MNVLYISSKEFLPYMTVSMVSLLENNKGIKDLIIHLYCEDIPEEYSSNLKKITESYSAKFKIIDNQACIDNFKNLISKNKFPEFCGCNYTYAKIFPNVLLPDLDKVLVIDSDTIILKNIQELYNTDIKGSFCAAIPELMANYVSSEDKQVINKKNYYYNTGVMLFDIQKMNTYGYNDKIINGFKSYSKPLKLADQSLFNLALNNDDVTALNFKYNYNNNLNLSKKLRKVIHSDYKNHKLLDIDKAGKVYKDMTVLHYVGALKPWDRPSFAPRKNLYRYYERKVSKLCNNEIKIRKSNKTVNPIIIWNSYKDFCKLKDFFEKNICKNPKPNKAVKNELNMKSISNTVAPIVAEEVLRGLAIRELHHETFKNFKFSHYNENVAVIGCGPSVKYYNNEIDAINIALNRALFLENLKFDYMFVWDYLGFKKNDPDFFERIKEHKECVKFYGKFINPEITSIPEFPDDNINKIKHFYSCKRWGLLGEKSKIMLYPDIENYPLADFMSVSFPAIQFALYTHPKALYLVGLDTIQAPNCAGFNNPYNTDEMKKGYKQFKRFAELHYPDIEIISVNPVGLKGLFKDVYTQSYVDAHPELSGEDIEIIDKVCINV